MRFALLLALAVLAHPLSVHLRAASLLLRFANPSGHSMLAAFDRHSVDVSSFDLPGTRGRIYSPVGVANAPGIVLAPGVHYKGIDEPRLERFAQTLAESGVVVLTPELRELLDYRIEPASIDTLGEAAIALATRLHTARVGVMGFSFAGGLALLAATDPRYAPAIGFVVTIGAHDDLRRVLRFFVTNEARRPDGTVMHLQAHPYGPAIIVYDHAEDFFPAGDVPVARDALRSWLHEDFDAARARAADLSAPAAATMKHVFDRDTAGLTPTLRRVIATLTPSFAAVSPASRLHDLRVPVFFLHGAGDSVIPPTETEWLAHDAPRALVRDVLVSHAIEHVALEGDTSVGDELTLVHFMSDVLDAAQGAM